MTQIGDTRLDAHRHQRLREGKQRRIADPPGATPASSRATATDAARSSPSRHQIHDARVTVSADGIEDEPGDFRRTRRRICRLAKRQPLGAEAAHLAAKRISASSMTAEAASHVGNEPRTRSAPLRSRAVLRGVVSSRSQNARREPRRHSDGTSTPASAPTSSAIAPSAC